MRARLLAYEASVGSGHGFRMRLGTCLSALPSRASDCGLCEISIVPTVSTQSKGGRSERYDGRSGNEIEIGFSAAISSCEGRDGSAGSGGGGISAATGKLGSAGSGGGGIAASGDTSGRVGSAGSSGVEGNVGSAGSGGGGISAATGKLGSAGSGGGGSAATTGGWGKIEGSFGCWDTCGSGARVAARRSGLTLALGLTGRGRTAERFLAFSAIVSA
jgi:hypothetical protein